MATKENSKVCFVIAPIGESDSDTRRWSDQVLRHIIRPSVTACGYEAVRADDIDRPGIITSQVIQRVVEEPLVIADLTERNPNVFYELAIRHAVGKPFIQIIKEGENIPFDVAATRTILVNINDLDKVQEAKNQLQQYIKSLEEDPSDLETPISVSLDLQHLRRSENPEQRSLADVLSALSAIRSMLSNVEERIAMDNKVHLHGKELHRLEKRVIEAIEQGLSIRRPSRRRLGSESLEFLHRIRAFPVGDGNAFSLPILLSYLRDDAPWVYEIGMEAYRQISRGDKARGLENISALLQLMHWTRETITHQPELHIVMDQLEGEFRTLLGEERNQIDHYRQRPPILHGRTDIV